MSLLINTDAMEVVDNYSWRRMKSQKPLPQVPERYLEFSVRVAQALDKEPAYHAKIAAPFVAMELCVGLWFGFMHYGFIGPDQYGRLTGQSPREVLKNARLADALIRWWQEVGYPYITRRDDVLARRRHRILDASAPGHGRLEDAFAHHRGIQAHACRSLRLGRGLASTAELDELCAGVHARHRCVVRHRSHGAGACILCAVPIPWEVVADGPEGSRHPANGTSRRSWAAKRSKLGADHADKVGGTTSGGKDSNE